MMKVDRIIPIQVPPERIVQDIFADFRQRRFIPDDALEVTALPHGAAGGVSVFVNPPCGEGLKAANDLGKPVFREGSLLQEDDAVDMVWHDNKSIQARVRIMQRQFAPTGFDRFAKVIMVHYPICDVPKQTFSLVRADSHKIPTRRRVIVIGKTQTPTSNSIMFPV